MSDMEGLWGPSQLARYLGYAESTVVRMATREPQKLPPRVSAILKPRWVPEVCRKWAEVHSRPAETKARIGRPRKAQG